jgi:hypothetical protein
MASATPTPAPERSSSGAGPGADHTTEDRQREVILGFSGLKAHLVLIALWFVGTGILIAESFGYAERARAFPLLTLGTMVLLLVIRTAQVVRTDRRLGSPTTPRSRIVRELVLLGWLVIAWVGVVLFGLIPGAMAFLIAYLAVHRPVGRVASVLVVVGLWGAVYVLFVQVLNLPLRPGILF